MITIADRMLELFRVPLTDPQWVQLFKELELNGSVLSKNSLNEKVFEYTLSKLGVRLYTDANGWVLTIHFPVEPSYPGELPFGLRPGFRVSEVHQLLGIPVRIDTLQKGESYTFSSFHVTVFYSLKDETLREIRLVPWSKA